MKTAVTIVTFLSTLFVQLRLSAQEEISKRLVLVGNTGGRESILNAIRQKALLDTNTTVIFLGNDNVISADSIATLHPLVDQLRTEGAKLIFIPGNEDWANGRSEGYSELIRKSDAVRSLNTRQVQLLPAAGCPGPEKLSLADDVELVFLNTQWWLHEYNKPGVESGCSHKNEMQILDELKDIVSDEREKLVIFIGHHPFRSTGMRSGYFGLKQHIFPLTDINGLRKLYLPLPVIGSIYPIARSVLISRQDMTHIRYQDMISSVDGILKDHPHLIRVAGHEHIQALYKEDENYYIVSGSGSRGGRVQRTPRTEYASEAQGFAVLEILDSKKVNVSFYEVEDDSVRVGYSNDIMNFSELPPMAEDTARLPMTSQEYVTSPVNRQFNKASVTKRFLLGENYRTEWATPVNLEVFNIDSDKGGYKIDGQGGGKQTTTIKLEDASGKKWSLRTITKDPEKVIPENFRNTLAQDAVNDVLSASHPYAAGPVSSITAALNIPAPEVEYYFIPNDTALGYHRPAFANTVAMLEEHDPSRYGEGLISTWKLFNQRVDKQNIRVDQHSFLRARMLDFLIADFDRHYDQFKWGEREENGTKISYAVPKDRDQAFFYSDGLVMKLLTYNRMPFLKGFRRDIQNPHWYGFVARDIDGLFLNQLDREDWKSELQDFKAALPDSVLKTSVERLPPEIYRIDGQDIIGKLIGRRNEIGSKGMDYYDFLAKKVNVVGSNNDEEFIISSDQVGLKVQVLEKDSATGEESQTYSRVFKDDETKEIRLYGLNGNDRFTMEQDVSSSIKFRIVGGAGADSFDIRGNAANILYDARSEDNKILNRNRTTNMISGRKDVNSYSFRENTHNTSKLPTINLGYNIEDRFLVGLGVAFTRHGFRKVPFASEHRLSTLFSFYNKAYQVKYSGEVTDIFRHYDVLMNTALVNPHINNFFGLGNETVKDTLKPMSFYRVRYSSFSGDISVRKRFIYNKLSLAAGPSFFYYWNRPERNNARILSRPADIGLDSNSVYGSKLYFGGHVSLEFNSVENRLLPEKGIYWNNDFSYLQSADYPGAPIPKFVSTFSLYAPLSSNRRFVFVLNAGGGHIFNDNFEYFQALTLGANNYLRGYRKNRFAGSSMAYTSVELRARLFKLQSRLLPGDLGIIGFSDLGRVWLRSESSNKWHNAHGGGLYFTPFNLVMLSALVARSEEETLFNISVGARLNITF